MVSPVVVLFYAVRARELASGVALCRAADRAAFAVGQAFGMDWARVSQAVYAFECAS